MKLTRGEYAICEYLALHSGQTFSKEQIYEASSALTPPGTKPLSPNTSKISEPSSAPWTASHRHRLGRGVPVEARPAMKGKQRSLNGLFWRYLLSTMALLAGVLPGTLVVRSS